MPSFLNRTVILQPDRLPAQATCNQNTVVQTLESFRLPTAPIAEVKDAIAPAIARIAEKASKAKTPGLAYGLVTSDGRVVADRVLCFGEQRALVTVIGRHSHSDTAVDWIDLSLRHLVAVQRKEFPDRIELRDPRSSGGIFTTSRERVLNGVIRLPLVLRLGSLFLAAFDTPFVPQGDWFEEALHRNLEDVQPVLAPRPLVVRLERHSLDALCETAAERASSDWTNYRLTPERLAQGFVIGRSERCDAPLSWTEIPDDLSRVHAMLFSSQGEPYIVDTGSTFGLRHLELGLIRYRHISPGDVFWLGKSCRLVVG